MGRKELNQIKQTKLFAYQIFLPKIVNIFLSFNFNICFGCSKEPSHWDGSFEYPQHMFWLRNKKKIFLITHCYLEAWKLWYFCKQLALASTECDPWITVLSFN